MLRLLQLACCVDNFWCGFGLLKISYFIPLLRHLRGGEALLSWGLYLCLLLWGLDYKREIKFEDEIG